MALPPKGKLPLLVASAVAWGASGNGVLRAPSYGETIIIHDATSKGAINYLNLASELLKKQEASKSQLEELIEDNE